MSDIEEIVRSLRREWTWAGPEHLEYINRERASAASTIEALQERVLEDALMPFDMMHKKRRHTRQRQNAGMTIGSMSVWAIFAAPAKPSEVPMAEYFSDEAVEAAARAIGMGDKWDDCPIGISPESSMICSAGTCLTCRRRRLSAALTAAIEAELRVGNAKRGRAYPFAADRDEWHADTSIGLKESDEFSVIILKRPDQCLTSRQSQKPLPTAGQSQRLRK